MPEQSAARLRELGYAVAIHPLAVLAHAVLGAFTALCQLRGIKADPFLPSRPEAFFDSSGCGNGARSAASSSQRTERWA
jgi:hypothetical protein